MVTLLCIYTDHWSCFGPVACEPECVLGNCIWIHCSLCWHHRSELVWYGWACLVWAPPLLREASFTGAYCFTGPCLCGGADKNIFKPSTSIRQPLSHRVCWSQRIKQLFSSPGVNFTFWCGLTILMRCRQGWGENKWWGEGKGLRSMIGK